MIDRADIVIVGAGAAGLMAAIWAGRTVKSHGSGAAVVALDGAKVLGAKILVAGGGRCNVTHHAVDESAYAGSSRNAIKKVLRSFDVPRTVEFFRELGVELKREETGKLFPTTDDAHTVLDALLGAAREAGVRIVHPWRVGAVEREGDEWVVRRAEAAGEAGEVWRCRRVILATGGMALPRTGSDGFGYELAKSLGHTMTPRTFPALVPLLLDPHHPVGAAIRSLSGLTFPATLDLRSYSGKRLEMFTNSTLCTHFGISGPGVLDISRHFLANKGSLLYLYVLPGVSPEELDAMLVKAAGGPQRSMSILRWLTDHAPHPAIIPEHGTVGLPERLARALCSLAAVDSSAPLHALTREQRRSLVETLTALRLPVTGDRGFTFAEATAGGVPLSELKLDTMESRSPTAPGLFLCGELCDVDGRIGGFNFQWAWSSGYLAGVGAAKSLLAAGPG